MLLRFDPFREIDRLTEQMVSGTRTARTVPMDVYRRGDAYVVDLDMPGVDASSIDLSIDRNTLTIRAERSPSHREDDEVLVAERPQGAFTRQLVLGDGLDVEGVSAEQADGVLRLTIPMAPTAKPRRVEIQSGRRQHEVLNVGTGSQKADAPTSEARREKELSTSSA
ncbi:MAG TPA: Hsp20/alpha crystallin family protein [Mycobacteriales bacterium]|nr:Hsp20/alpha crystallin family protein [Mycobacteriales bacterium]